MRDDDPRASDRLDHVLERQEVDQLGPGRTDRGRAVLHDELLLDRELADRLEQSIEPRLVRPDGDEDHVPAEKTLPTNRARGRSWASSGHCTYCRSAIGAMSR